jgi:AraC-like DNA-binding protein
MAVFSSVVTYVMQRIPGLDSKKKGRKDQDSAALVRNDTAMLRTLTNIGKGDTAERLRRGLSPTRGPRAVDTMARAACFSRRQFHRLTMQLVGETPGAHQRRLRLDRGAWLLLTSRARILDIALETGWESHETFRAFRARFRVTPSAFRKGRGVTLPPSMRAGFAIALQAATHSTNSGRRCAAATAKEGEYNYAKENS